MSEIAILRSTLKGHKNSVWSVAFHPTLPLLATGSDDTTAKLWRFSPDGSAATCVATLAEHSKYVLSVAFHPTAPILATGSLDNTAKLWRFSPNGTAENNMQATCVATLADHSSVVFSVAFHPTLPLLATGSEDSTAKLWRYQPDGSAATCVATLRIGIVRSVAFHPTAPILATGSLNNTVKLWRFSPDGSAATCVATLRIGSWVWSVAFHPRAPFLATGSQVNTAELWRFEPDGSAENNMQAKFLETLAGHRDYVWSVAFHPTAPLLATASKDKTVKLWRFSHDGSEATCVATLIIGSSVNSVAFHPTLPILATGGDNKTVELWKLDLDSINLSNFSFEDFIINNENGIKIITVNTELLESKNTSNKLCPSFKPLYKKIMETYLNKEFLFIFKGQPGIDIGGLTRSIFDKVLPVYTDKFFDSIEKNNEFIILKNISVNDKIFKHETNQLLLLAKKANTKIFLRIDPRLLDLLLSPDLKKYFSNNKKIFSKFYKNVNNAIQNKTYDILNSSSNSIFLRINKNQNNKNRVINEYKKKIDPFSNKWEEEPPQIMSMNNFNNLGQEKDKEQKQDIKNVLIREIRLRRFLAECGFSSWEQVQNMYLFIKKFWKPENFSSELKFDIESFSKKIKIFKENNYNDIIEISLDKFIKLSINNSMQFDFNNLNSNISKIYAEYTFFRPFLNYILGPESTDESRKLFVNYVAGTIYYPGELYLILSHQFAPYPFKSETCFQKLKFFKNNPENSQLKINNATKFIEKEIKPNRGSVNFGFA